MTTAEITSLLQFTNGNVEQVSEILKGLDIKGPLAGPKKKRRKKKAGTETESDEESDKEEDSTPRLSARDKVFLEDLMKYTKSAYDHEKVKVLRVSGSRNEPFPNLPSQIQFFVSLRDLRIEETAITSLPAEIGTLLNLKSFQCENNMQLAQLPREIGDLTQLEQLYCNNNQLRSLPVEIGKLRQLWILDCGRNQLTSLPTQIGRLSDLTELHCNENQLRSLPEEIGDLKQLQVLQCTVNLLTRLPEGIGGLTGLQRLVCGENRLTVLPKTIGKMEALQFLNCSSNRLTSLPAEISRMPDLNTVIADKNPFYRLPLYLGRDVNSRIGYGGHDIIMYAPQGIRSEQDMIKYLDEQNINGIYDPNDLLELMDNFVRLNATSRITIKEMRALYQKEKKGFHQKARGFVFMNERINPLEKELADLIQRLDDDKLTGEPLDFIQQEQVEKGQQLSMDEKKEALRSFVFDNKPIFKNHEKIPMDQAKIVIASLREDFRSTYVVLERDQDKDRWELVAEE